MADADDDVSGVSALLAKTSLDRDQSIEVSGKEHELNSAEDGNNIGEGVDACIKSREDANLSDDEDDEDDEDYDDDDWYESEDAEDVEEEKGEQESKDPHLQVKGAAISPRREVTEYMTPVTAADFLAKPTGDKLLALGPERAEKVIREIRNKRYMFEKGGLLIEFATISSLMYSENNDVKDAVYQISVAILKRLFSSEEFAPGFLQALLLLSVVAIFRGVDKLRSASGMLLTLEHAVNQQYFNEGTAQERMMIFLSCINSSTPTQSYLPCCTMNVYSILTRKPINRLQTVCDIIHKSKVEIIAMTETWLEPKGPRSTIGDISGHGFVHHPRAGRGGGTGLLFKDTINARQVVAGEKKSFEFACYRISIGSFQLKLINIYRPPSSESHPVPISDFFPEFEEFLKEHLLCNIPVIITGDFNIHVNNIDNPDKKSFMDILDRLSCTQHVDFRTHTGGNTLDLVITRKSDQGYESLGNIIVGRPWCGPLVRDHYSVMYLLKSVKAPVPSMKTSSRKIGCIDIKSLKNDVANSPLCLQTPDNLPESVALYFDILRSILNKHAPLIPNVTPHPQANSSYLNMTTLHPVLPPFVDKTKFVNDLGQFFFDKIVRIHSDNTSVVDDESCTPDDIFLDRTDFQISHFKTLCVEDVEKLVTNLSKNSCSLDPMPTKLVLQCSESLLLVLKKIINLSLSTGHFPSDWKVALVKPLLEKYDMDFKFNNLRPVSNLPFISTLVEGAATQQIAEHICNGALFPSMQSAYRQFHSTETALVRIKNDLQLAMDNQKVTLVVLLDLSAAFDTIDHGKLLNILHSSFGLSDIVLSWIESYLYKRQQEIILDDVISKKFDVPYGVPQGSRHGLGFLLFTLYISNLIKIIHSFPNVSCHFYADDTHLYISFSPDKEHQYDDISILEPCIRSLMFKHKLMLDDAKTEFLIVGTSSQLTKLKTDHLVAGDSEKLSSSVRNLFTWICSDLNTCESAHRLLQSPFNS